MLYLFYDQPGTVPGYPGHYAHCQVRVTEKGLEVTPLLQVPHVLESETASLSFPTEGETTAAPDEKDAATQQGQKRKGVA